MAAFDFPSSPSVNQTYTANGVTWKWNGTMWMRVSGAGYLEKIEEGNSKIEVDDSGTGNVTVTTDGTERVRIDNVGWLGLNQTTKDNAGQVAAFKNTNNANSWLSVNVNNNTGIGGVVFGDSDSWAPAYIQYDHTNNYMQFISNAAERLRITADGDIIFGTNGAFYDYSTGRMGVGTVSPGSTRLHVKGHSSLNSSLLVDVNTGDTTLGFAQNGTEKWRIENVNSDDALRFYDVPNTAERLRITSGGDISIGGLASPRAKLDIEDAGTSKDVILRVSADDNNPYALVVANDTFNTTSNRGFAFWVGTDKVHHIEARTSTTNSENEIMISAGDAITFRTNVSQERLRITAGGNIWHPTGGNLFLGSTNLGDFTSAGIDNFNRIGIRAGSATAGTTPDPNNCAIKIYPANVRTATTGTLSGGIAWQHLDPSHSTWDSSYGDGAQIWMGAALHDVPGQERDRFNLWMNSGTTGNSQPGNLAIEAYPNGMVRHPKVPAFMVRNSTAANAFAANARATWDISILNNGSHFDMTNDVFTAPIDGIYTFNCMMLSNANTRLFHNFRVNNTIIDGTRSEGHAVSGSYMTCTITMTYTLSANDYVDVYVRNNNAYGGVYTNFNGYLVG